MAVATGDLFAATSPDEPVATPVASADRRLRPARSPRFVTLDGRQIDTSSQEWMLVCLARHICRIPALVDRQGFIGKLKWEAAAINELRQLVRREWRRMYPNGRSGQGC